MFDAEVLIKSALQFSILEIRLSSRITSLRAKHLPLVLLEMEQYRRLRKEIQEGKSQSELEQGNDTDSDPICQEVDAPAKQLQP